MKHLRVTNIQRGCVSDGPGVRTTVFLKGCHLRCPWCCNPEALLFEEQWFYLDEKCLKKSMTSKLCNECIKKGGNRDVYKCPFGTYEATSKDYSVKELLAVLLSDRSLFLESNGGVTFSGGEPLLQAENMYVLIKKLYEEGIDVAVETTLFLNSLIIEKVLPYINTWIVDLKIQPEMYLADADYHNIIKKNISLLNEKSKSLCFRLVFVNSMAYMNNKIAELLKGLGVTKIELLKAHFLGADKYKKLGEKASDYSADEKLYRRFATELGMSSINVDTLSA